jgi:hypothetical protein|tara:strand:- start:423 stop:1004 length:582 start_codon:yes stop_codon:yes gene_type:complete
MVANPPVGDPDREAMAQKTLAAVACALAMLWTTPASATDTVTSATVSSSTVVDKSPPTASSPSIVVNNSDICQTGTSGAVQTSFFGISGGTTTRDLNCERIKLARAVYGMGLKVAGISLLCQDLRVWNALWMAGTPCPYLGAIGDAAKERWLAEPDMSPDGSIIRVAAQVEADKVEAASAPEVDDEYNQDWGD